MQILTKRSFGPCQKGHLTLPKDTASLPVVGSRASEKPMYLGDGDGCDMAERRDQLLEAVRRPSSVTQQLDGQLGKRCWEPEPSSHWVHQSHLATGSPGRDTSPAPSQPNTSMQGCPKQPPSILPPSHTLLAFQSPLLHPCI